MYNLYPLISFTYIHRPYLDESEVGGRGNGLLNGAFNLVDGKITDIQDKQALKTGALS
jgi:hypothetical protein